MSKAKKVGKILLGVVGFLALAAGLGAVVNKTTFEPGKEMNIDLSDGKYYTDGSYGSDFDIDIFTMDSYKGYEFKTETYFNDYNETDEDGNYIVEFDSNYGMGIDKCVLIIDGYEDNIDKLVLDLSDCYNAKVEVKVGLVSYGTEEIEDDITLYEFDNYLMYKGDIKVIITPIDDKENLDYCLNNITINPAEEE